MKEPVSIFGEILKLIDLLAEEMKNGDEIVWEARQKELRWCWRNTRTGQEHFVRLSDTRRIDRRNDICFNTVVDFVQGRKNAIETKKWIEKIDGLKAFV